MEKLEQKGILFTSELKPKYWKRKVEDYSVFPNRGNKQVFKVCKWYFSLQSTLAWKKQALLDALFA